MRALSKAFRAKLLEGLRRTFEGGKLGDDTSVPMLCDTLRHRAWVVYAKPPFAGPESVLGYLGAYTHRIAISNTRIRRIEHGRVTFRVRDSANANKQKLMQLDEHDFIRRFLLHVMPKGFVPIRHYGLLANRNRREKIARCRDLLAAPKPKEPASQTRREKLLELTGFDIGQCPARREGRMGVVEQIDPHRRLLAPSRPNRNEELVMSRKVKQLRRLAPTWGAPLAPGRNGCVTTSGDDSEPTLCRRLLNRFRSTIVLETLTTHLRTALAA